MLRRGSHDCAGHARRPAPKASCGPVAGEEAGLGPRRGNQQPRVHTRDVGAPLTAIPIDSVSPADRYLQEDGASGLFTRLTRVGLLLDAFQHRCFDAFGLRFIDYSVLRVLHLADRPYRMSPSELTDLLLRSSGGMTQILDRLESAGL